MEPWLLVALTSVASILASSGFWAFLTRRSTINSAQTRLLMGLAYDKITHFGLSYIERGWISKDEYEEFRKYLYEPYVAMGGNGMAERIMAAVSELPLRSHSKYAEIIQQRKPDERESHHGSIS